MLCFSESKLAIGDDLIVKMRDVRKTFIGKGDGFIRHLLGQSDKIHRNTVSGFFKAVGHRHDFQGLFVLFRFDVGFAQARDINLGLEMHAVDLVFAAFDHARLFRIPVAEKVHH